MVPLDREGSFSCRSTTTLFPSHLHVCPPPRLRALKGNIMYIYVCVCVCLVGVGTMHYSPLTKHSTQKQVEVGWALCGGGYGGDLEG